MQHLFTKQLPHNANVSVLTTSTSGEDVKTCYDLGGNSYVTKPASFRQLVEILKTLTKYWFDTVELPPKTGHGHGGKSH